MSSNFFRAPALLEPSKPEILPRPLLIASALTGLGSSLRLFVRRVLPARTAKLLRLHALGMLLLVLRRGVVPVFTLTTLQRNDFSHFLNSFSQVLGRL